MKQTLKSIMSCALILACVIAMTACGSAKTEESGIDEMLSSSMITTAEGLTEAIVVLSDEEIASYKESGDAFTETAMESWESMRDELGTYESLGKSRIEESSHNGYEVIIPAQFTGRNADIIYSFDDQGTPTALTINAQYTVAENMQKAGLNTLMGVGIVFVMLIFLSILISLFKFIPKLEEKFSGKEKETPSAAPAAVNKAVQPAAVAAPDNTELIAVITAAIAASEGTSTDSFVVRSIKKVNRKKW